MEAINGGEKHGALTTDRQDPPHPQHGPSGREPQRRSRLDPAPGHDPNVRCEPVKLSINVKGAKQICHQAVSAK